jgi:CBS domain-containing protein
MLMSQVMTIDVVSVSPYQSLKYAAQIMEINDFDALPVCTDFRLVGLISIRDIVVKAVDKGLSLDDTTICEVMSGDARYVFEDQLIEYALNLMCEYGISRILVLNREYHLVGIVSLEDILKIDCESSVPTSNSQIRVSRQILSGVAKQAFRQENVFGCSSFTIQVQTS